MISASPTLKPNKRCVCWVATVTAWVQCRLLPQRFGVGSGRKSAFPPNNCCKEWLPLASPWQPAGIRLLQSKLTPSFSSNSVFTLSRRLEEVQVQLLPVWWFQIFHLLEDLGGQSEKMQRVSGRSGGDRQPGGAGKSRRSEHTTPASASWAASWCRSLFLLCFLPWNHPSCVTNAGVPQEPHKVL